MNNIPAIYLFISQTFLDWLGFVVGMEGDNPDKVPAFTELMRPETRQAISKYT